MRISPLQDSHVITSLERMGEGGGVVGGPEPSFLSSISVGQIMKRHLVVPFEM